MLQQSGLLESKNVQVRLTALATLGKLGFRREADTLVSALNFDPDHSVRAAAANGLGNVLRPEDGAAPVTGGEKALHALIRAANEDGHVIVRYAALVSIGDLGNPAAIHVLLPIVRNLAAPTLEAAAAIRALGDLVHGNSVSKDLLRAISARVADRDELIRAAVARRLGRWLDIGSVPELLKRMEADEKQFGQSTHVQAVLDNVRRSP